MIRRIILQVGTSINLLPLSSLEVHCYPERIAEVRPRYKTCGSREADAKPPVRVVLFYCLHCDLSSVYSVVPAIDMTRFVILFNYITNQPRSDNVDLW